MIQKERPRPNGNRDNKISRWQDKCFLSLLKNSTGASYWKWGKDKVQNVCSSAAHSQPSMSLSPSSLLCYMAPVLMGSFVKRPTFTSASGMSLLSLFSLVRFHLFWSFILHLPLTTPSPSFVMSSGHLLHSIEHKHAHVSVWDCTLVDVGECSSMWTCMETRFWFRVSSPVILHFVCDSPPSTQLLHEQ